MSNAVLAFDTTVAASQHQNSNRKNKITQPSKISSSGLKLYHNGIVGIGAAKKKARIQTVVVAIFELPL
jgi:hypothetical protein